MYHCHISLHEDEGMMGQFVVTTPTGISTVDNHESQYTLYPNPATDKLYVKFDTEHQSAYYVRITDEVGRTMLMLPKPELQEGIDISHLSRGMYTLQLTDDQFKQTTSKKFVVE